MPGDRERDRAFALLFLVADGPLLLVEGLPATGWTLALGPLLALVSWVGAGTYLVAAARSPSIRGRGWADAPWLLATMAIPVGLVALNPLVAGRPASEWTPMAAIGATILVGLFWGVYVRGGGALVGPAPARYGLRSLALEDRVVVVGLLLALPAGVGLLAVWPEAPPWLVLALVGGGPLGSYVAAMWWMGRRRRRGWARLARGLGWEETEGHRDPLEGAVRGRRARVGTIRERARWLTFWTTDVHVELDPVPDLELHVRREGRLGRLQRALGARDAQVGQDRWDERFLVATDDPEAAEALFRVLGDRLLDVRGEVKALLVDGDVLVAAQPGVVADPTRVRRVLHLLDRAAEVLEEEATADGEDGFW